MNKKTALVLKGFIELSETEKAEAIDELKKYLAGSRAIQESLSKSYDSVKGSGVTFGPLKESCPCCGR